MPSALTPFRVEPRPSRRLWGGRRLEDLLNLSTSADQDPVGEAWLVGPESTIDTGRYAGRTLQDVADGLGADLLGTASLERYGTKVPLLLKLIDAAQPLSVQVHPDDAYALREEAGSGHLGKEEAWLILDADPDATIVWGFERLVGADDVRAAIEEERLEDLVRTVDVEAGDVIYNPAGTVHAIGAGIFLFEVQQASDLTYRLYDYGRTDAQGRTRELHVDQALAVADLGDRGDAKVPPGPERDGWTVLVETPYFVMEHRDLAGAIEASTDPASLETLTFANGEGSVRAAGESTAFHQASVVLPAELGAYEVEGEGQLLRCRLPSSVT